MIKINFLPGLFAVLLLGNQSVNASEAIELRSTETWVTVISPECIWCYAQLKVLDSLQKQTAPDKVQVLVLADSRESKAEMRWRKYYQGKIEDLNDNWRIALAGVKQRPLNLWLDSQGKLQEIVKGKVSLQEIQAILYQKPKDRK